MIADYLKERVHEDYQKFMLEIDTTDSRNDEFQVSKFHILNTMISLKFGLFPFLDKNGYKTDNILDYYDRKKADKKRVLDCKNYKLFRYDFKGLDVLIHRRSSMLTAFVLYDKFPDIVDDKRDSRWSDFYGRFGVVDNSERHEWEVNSWTELYNRNERYTNLTFDEFAEVSEKLHGYNFICFDISPNDKTGNYYTKHTEFVKFLENDFTDLNTKDNKKAMLTLMQKYEEVIELVDNNFTEDSVKFSKLLKEQLDKCLNQIIERPKHPFIEYKTLDGFEINKFIDLSSEKCEIKSGWARDIFDLTVDFIYTKED